jgi:hypothetical protein
MDCMKTTMAESPHRWSHPCIMPQPGLPGPWQCVGLSLPVLQAMEVCNIRAYIAFIPSFANNHKYQKFLNIT